jgi:hypothetical protein
MYWLGWLAQTGRPPVQDKVSDQSLLEQEHEGLLRNLKSVESSLGIDMFMLAMSLKYVERVLANCRMKGFLQNYHTDKLALLIDLVEKTRAELEDAA